uniref:hypothetical protein n=1 Tax=uncultured Sphingomonas sp. TaxID=158754 RepID=UPI0035CB2B86
MKAMVVTFMGFAVIGLADFGWLGMALAIIIAVAMIFREGPRNQRFWVVLIAFMFVHVYPFCICNQNLAATTRQSAVADLCA